MTEFGRKSSRGHVPKEPLKKKTAKPVSKKAVTTAQNNALQAAVDDLVFLPNPAQRAAKAQFWARYEPIHGETVTAALVMDTIPVPRIQTWWSRPGFKEWFRNETEAKERLEYLFHLSLDTAEQLLLDPEAPASSKVNLIKVIGILAGKEPAKQSSEPQYLDAEIQKMDKRQLEALVRRKAAKLLDSGE